MIKKILIAILVALPFSVSAQKIGVVDLMTIVQAAPETAAAQEEIGAIIQIGAAVASIRKASFAREILLASVTGLIIEPTVRQLK